MLPRLREQGWPAFSVNWTGSFMTKRACSVRLGGHTTQSAPLQCELPQGSPISPILFLLYVQPIVER
ncbi:hypothetical protein K470DRAFT_216148 [Piedraia hortae CBS 480.64]|uniref:Uncharacterized protein n=1 Tax=Piedraia hortae CBS 480.64 TaxID=1314780 RepID=A0A6A7C081_9PEZI|nr:hypothetical protein K470DRAFT_216148 [Piedraia hortae CBS 480.64]